MRKKVTQKKRVTRETREMQELISVEEVDLLVLQRKSMEGKRKQVEKRQGK